MGWWKLLSASFLLIGHRFFTLNWTRHKSDGRELTRWYGRLFARRPMPMGTTTSTVTTHSGQLMPAGRPVLRTCGVERWRCKKRLKQSRRRKPSVPCEQGGLVGTCGVVGFRLSTPQG
jgi:hypothetical protein